MKGLPTQKRCASHTLCLVANDGVKEAMKNKQYSATHNTAFEKLQAFWSKSSGPKASELIKAILGVCVVRPCPTRWNSLYDSVGFLLKLDLAKLNMVFVQLEIPVLTEKDYKFLRNYMMIMKPIAESLDHLQSNVYYAVLIPKLYTARVELKEIETNKLGVCAVLLKQITISLERRFSYIFDFDDPLCIPALIATCMHPCFKIRWLQDPNDIEKVKSLIISVAQKDPVFDAQNDDNIEINNKSNSTVADEGKTRSYCKTFSSEICIGN